MKINFDSLYKKYSNQTIKWLQTDSEESFKKNSLTKYQQLKDNGWLNTEIDYTFNEYGFRCGNWQNKESILFLGCSFTVGVGLPLETIWPELVCKHFNYNCANLAIGSGAADTAFRLCLGYLDKINPKIVVYLPPPGVRIELSILNEMLQINYGSYMGNEYNVLIRQFYKLWLAGEENNHHLNKLKNSLAIKHLCEVRKIPCVELDIKNFEELDLARDLMHLGIKSNLKFSQYVIQEINKLEDLVGLEPTMRVTATD